MKTSRHWAQGSRAFLATPVGDWRPRLWLGRARRFTTSASRSEIQSGMEAASSPIFTSIWARTSSLRGLGILEPVVRPRQERRQNWGSLSKLGFRRERFARSPETTNLVGGAI